MTNKEIAYEKIKELVEKFEEYISTYKHTDYNETQTRIEFINPFWEALGWDVDNQQKKAPHNCEVLHEVKPTFRTLFLKMSIIVKIREFIGKII